jgi:hypothetical protein
MTTLNLTIRGLCGLVPNEPVPEEPDPEHTVNRLRVLVLNAQKLGEREGLTLCPHEARLIIDPEGQAKTINLNQHKIEIDGLDVSQRVRFETDFWSIAQMNQVTKEKFDVADEFLREAVENDGIVASLRLPTGVVTGFDLSPQEQDFRNGSPSYRKRFARAVHVRLDLAGPGTIRVTPFDDGGQAESVSVADGTGSVDMVLTTLCDPAQEDSSPTIGDGISDVAVFAEEGALPTSGDESGDFAVFYALIPAYEGDRFVPANSPRVSQATKGKAAARSMVQGGATSVHSGCVPAVYNDNSEA